jgi:hypothetical protein
VVVEVICFFCHKVISRADMAHRYEWHSTISGVMAFGQGAEGGALASVVALSTPLVKVSHGKCYHAVKKQQELADARAADPEFQPPQDTDWRHQEIVELEDLAGEGHGGNRGAGEARC